MFGTPTLVGGLGVEDRAATMTSDELTIVFASTRPPNAGGYDLWTASRSARADAFGPARRLDALASADNDDAPSMSPDGLTLYFQQGWRIVVTTRSSTVVDFPAAAIDAVFDTTDPESHPFLTATALYFTRQRACGCMRPPTEIWRADRTACGFGVPEPVSELNEGSVYVPVLSIDELTIYFGSIGGGISRATRGSTVDAFSSIEPVTELSSTGGVWPAHLSDDGCRLYFGSYLGGTYSGLYVAERAP